MLKVTINDSLVGILDRYKGKRYSFTYAHNVSESEAISLIMPPRPTSYMSSIGHLHPIFDMNLPEGYLRQWLSKAIINFDDLTLLGITGASQIGRLQYESEKNVPSSISIKDILSYDGAEDLFQYLLHTYAMSSGISGVQPKVLVRDTSNHKISQDHKVTVLGATHIVKTWDAKFQHLAYNENFCLCAARYSGLQVPDWDISQNGKFLIIDRFDMTPDSYLGIEDMCALAGMTTDMKYNGSYEQLGKMLKIFIRPEDQSSALRDYFKMVALSCIVRNGDAHRKNFCVLYDDTRSRTGRLAPTFDVVTTTPYIPMDSMALTMAGSKRWPSRKKLLQFAGICDLSSEIAEMCLLEVENGVSLAKKELLSAISDVPEFTETGLAMVSAWEEGLMSVQDQQLKEKSTNKRRRIKM